MNIFVLDFDPRKAANMACDRHVIKMISESTQLLSTAHHLLRPSFAKRHDFFKPTHVNHPCNAWIREDDANYRWLYRLLLGYLDEYDLRFGKPNKFQRTRSLLPYLEYSPLKVRTKREPKKFALAVKYPECIHSNPVVAYRRYYLLDKVKFATWKYSKPPNWYVAGMNKLKRGEPIESIDLLGDKNGR